ncbi:NAD(P)-binding protein [Violaceomyces palustris]|uniref:NAD(P)-binding protein n=1 Tax=Violaceomyces palustris TaxID=1673888 RepID=A0ACD0P8C0_9BASI|nr:NAD(P)-binding protein [Violaceomyces palustris]
MASRGPKLTFDSVTQPIAATVGSPSLATLSLIFLFSRVIDKSELSFTLKRRDLDALTKAEHFFSLLVQKVKSSRWLKVYLSVLLFKYLNHIGNRFVIDKQAPRKIRWPEHVVVITGAARGILGEVACQLSEKGAKVAAIDAAPRSDHGKETLYIQADVTDGESMAKAKKQVEDKLGLCTMLIPGAGLARHGFILDPPSITPFTFPLKVSDVNLHGVVNTLKVFGEDMLPDGGRLGKNSISQARNQWGGHILLIGSGAAFIVLPANGTYNASKAGVLSLHETLSTELESWHNVKNVRNSVICPLKVDTAMTEGRMKDTHSQFMLPTLTAGQVASKIVEMLEEDRSQMVFMPRAAYLLSYVRNLPPWAVRLVHRAAGSFGTFSDYASRHRGVVADK